MSSRMASPGKVTNTELMEILFGYLIFSGFDRVAALLGSFIFPGDKDKEKQRGPQIIQLVFIVLAVVVLFWHKFRV